VQPVTGFSTPAKQLRIINVCLNETYRPMHKVHTGRTKHVYRTFVTQNGPKKGDYLSLLRRKFVLQ
jgi:hypothetical protein